MAASSLRQVGKALDADVELGGRSTPSTGAYVMAMVSGLCFALAGLFFVPVLTAFSDMAFKPVTEWNADIMPGGMIAGSAMLFVGASLGFAALWRSGNIACGFHLTTATGLVGAGLGVAVGVVLGFGADGLLSNLSARLPALVAAGLLLLGVLFAALAASAIHKAKRRAEARVARQASGHVAEGRIADLAFTNTWIMGQPVFDVIVDFSCPTGPVRARGTLVTPAMTTPAVGMPVTVTYNPHQPTDAEFALNPAVKPVWAPGMQQA